MGGANGSTVIGCGFVAEAKSNRVQIREHGNYFDVCWKESLDDEWIPVVAHVKTKELADVVVAHLKKIDMEA